MRGDWQCRCIENEVISRNEKERSLQRAVPGLLDEIFAVFWLELQLEKPRRYIITYAMGVRKKGISV
jgi:hypothetical protein